MKLPLLIIASATLAFSQPFSAGVKVGLPLTDFVNTVNGATQASTNRYVVGPQAELRLPAGFGVEFDALYRHFNFTNPAGSGLAALTRFGHSGDWEFPLVAKYKLPSKVVRPYVEAGVAWDALSGLTTAAGVTAQHNTVMGAVAGGGIEIHVLVLHIAPELRYTRWTSAHFSLSNVLSSNQNQAEFLVGIVF